MRVLRIIFTACIGLLVVGISAFFIVREVVLSMAVSQIRSQVRFLKSAQVDPAFTQSCLEYGGSPRSNAPLIRAQLRFTTSSEYVVEVICVGAPTMRHVLREGALPSFAQKMIGQSGVIEGGTDQGVTIEVFGRFGWVFERDSIVQGTTQQQPGDTASFTNGPTTVCAGYGYTCCGEISQVGQGEHQVAALDCPRTCFASCAERPVVLSFQSQEPPLSEGRILSLRSGQTVRFVYTLSDVSYEEGRLLAQLDSTGSVSAFFLPLIQTLTKPQRPSDALRNTSIIFGDGSTTEVSGLQGAVDHTYTCTRPLCVYNATLQAVTQNGITSSLTDGSRIQVQVSP